MIITPRWNGKYALYSEVYFGLHFGSKKIGKISLVFKDLLINKFVLFVLNRSEALQVPLRHYSSSKLSSFYPPRPSLWTPKQVPWFFANACRRAPNGGADRPKLWGGGGRVKWKIYMKTKKNKINSVGWQYTRIYNNKTNKAQASRFCSNVSHPTELGK